MDYGAAYAKERLTGRGYFQPTGQTYYLDLGNVQMLECDFGIKRKEHFASRRGVLSMDRYDAYSSMGAWKVTVDEFVTPTLAILWGGQAGTALSQTIGTAATFMFTSKKGQAFKVGKYGLSNASLTLPTTKVEGVDYVIDRAGGMVYIPNGSTIADAASCTVTYDAPVLSYDFVTALNTLNSPGNLELQGEDDSGANKGAAADAVPPIRYSWQFTGILSVDKSGQYKPDDYRAAELVITLTQPMKVYRLTT